MPKFTTYSQIQDYLEKNALQIMSRSGDLERVLANALADMAWQYVYDAYTPEKYNRREDEGGLVDQRNFAITDFKIEDGKALIVFENLTQGNDNLKEVYLSDTIEEGIEANWNKTGEWSESRPYVAKTIEMLKENPDSMIRAIKQGFIEKGFILKM